MAAFLGNWGYASDLVVLDYSDPQSTDAFLRLGGWERVQLAPGLEKSMMPEWQEGCRQWAAGQGGDPEKAKVVGPYRRRDVTVVICAHPKPWPDELAKQVCAQYGLDFIRHNPPVLTCRRARMEFDEFGIWRHQMPMEKWSEASEAYWREACRRNGGVFSYTLNFQHRYVAVYCSHPDRASPDPGTRRYRAAVEWQPPILWMSIFVSHQFTTFHRTWLRRFCAESGFRTELALYPVEVPIGEHQMIRAVQAVCFAS
jgi:hypothetical protein